MGCGCQQKERGNYENIKKIAQKYSKSEKVTVAIYATEKGIYSFISIDCKEYREITPIEFISPLQ